MKRQGEGREAAPHLNRLCNVQSSMHIVKTKRVCNQSLRPFLFSWTIGHDRLQPLVEKCISSPLRWTHVWMSFVKRGVVQI